MNPDFDYCTFLSKMHFFLFFLFVCLKPKYDLLTSHSVRDVCGSNLQTNLEDIKSHRRVYCIEFSLVDKVSFLATEAILLSVIYFKTRDPINNQSIDVQTLADMITLNLVGLNIYSFIVYRVTFQRHRQFHVDTSGCLFVFFSTLCSLRLKQ